MSHYYDIIKKGEKMQIDRLFQIIYILLEKKTVTAKELAEKFEVSTRTIYRDIETLSSSQIPIYASKGKGGGISLLDDYILDKTVLTEKERNQILFALQGISKISNQDEKNTLEKISNIFNKSKTNWIEVDLSDWGTNLGADETFKIIKEAVINKKVLEFIYYNTYGEEKKRKACPLQIYFKDKAWYLKAYCKEKEDYRLFKISRMKEIKIIEETFEIELPEIKEKRIKIKTIKLELEISKNMTYRVYDEFKKEEITQKANGDFIIKTEIPENDWVYGYILSFGENIKVISPEYAKKIIKEKLQKSIKNYL